jgi:Cys-tRNA(Pro)/Cys-tRNA(Cys) deacylase
VLKTLLALVDDKPVCVVLPSDREANMKAVARLFGGKTARMMPPADAERITGYRVGGISPFGQKRRVPIAVEASVAALDLVYVNGGQRGLQIRMAPNDLTAALGAAVADLIA